MIIGWSAEEASWSVPITIKIPHCVFEDELIDDYDEKKEN